MSLLTLRINRKGVYEEVAKATDYTGTKLMTAEDSSARDRILAGDVELSELGRFWDEAVMRMNERLKTMFIRGGMDGYEYSCELEVSKSFDMELRGSVEAALRSYFIAYIIGLWFTFANKGKAGEYMVKAGDFLTDAERILYSRMRPRRPKD